MLVSPLRSDDPSSLGPFTLLGRVAVGGMGIVYLGREGGRADSLVVVKTVRPSEEPSLDVVGRLRGEARLNLAVAATIDPPRGLARLVRASPDTDPPWIATEYVPGPSLEAAARGRALPARAVVEAAVVLAETVAHLHRLRYAHRDVKPANVVLGPDGARLVDLGLGRRLGAPIEPVPLGSPGWSPPEQQDADADPRPGDVHGWAMTIGYAATGRPPFGVGPAESVSRRMRTDVPLLPAVEGQLRELLVAALHPDPRSRPRADDLVEALRAQRSTTLLAPRPPARVGYGSTRAMPPQRDGAATATLTTTTTTSATTATTAAVTTSALASPTLASPTLAWPTLASLAVVEPQPAPCAAAVPPVEAARAPHVRRRPAPGRRRLAAVGAVLVALVGAVAFTSREATTPVAAAPSPAPSRPAVAVVLPHAASAPATAQVTAKPAASRSAAPAPRHRGKSKQHKHPH